VMCLVGRVCGVFKARHFTQRPGEGTY